MLLSAGVQWESKLHLSWGDIAVNNHDSPSLVQVHLKQSKCDQFGNGVKVILGKTDNDLCPVQALSACIAQRSNKPGPFFVDSQNKAITKQWFTKQLRLILEAMGLPQELFAGHSLRIGAATTAALKGLEGSMILKLGRWSSSAFWVYVRTPPGQLASVFQTLATK